MADRDATAFTAAAAAASATDQELERLRAENAELRRDAESWAHIAGIARGALQQGELIADTLAWHEITLIRVRERLRTVGWRYECSCLQGWQSGLFLRHEHNSRATKQRAARRHVADQIVEALKVAADVERQIQGGECGA